MLNGRSSSIGCTSNSRRLRVWSGDLAGVPRLCAPLVPCEARLLPLSDSEGLLPKDFFLTTFLGLPFLLLLGLVLLVSASALLTIFVS